MAIDPPSPIIPEFFTDAHACAVGRVIAVWASTHRLFPKIIMTMLRDAAFQDREIEHADYRAALIANGMPDRTALGLIKSLGSSLVSDDVARVIDKEVDALLKDSQKRDIIAHAMWLKGKRPNSIRVTVLKTVGSVKLTPHEFTVAELNALAARMQKHMNELLTTMAGIGLPVVSSPETPPGPDFRERTPTPPRHRRNTKKPPKPKTSPP